MTVKIAVSGRMEKLITGELSVEDLDDEELARGQCRDSAGGFSGRPARVIPRELQQEMIRRLLGRGDELWRSAYNVAIRVFLEVAADPNNSAADRMKAAQYIIERVAGKTPDTVRLEATDPVVQIFRALLGDPDALEDYDDVEDAEVVEEEQRELVGMQSFS